MLSETISPERAPAPVGRVLRRWALLIILLAALGAGGGAAYALHRAPSYSTTSVLNVGRLDVQTQAIPGYVQAGQALANAYSTVVTSDLMVVPLARENGWSTAYVRSHLSASQVPDETTMRITASGPTAAAAQRLAREATARIITYVNGVQNTSSLGNRLLARYSQVSAAADRASKRAANLQADLGARRPGVTQAQVNQALQQAATLQLRAQTLANLFQQARTTSSSKTPIVVLDNASTVTSDRTTVLERLAFAGFAGGLVLGIALVVLIANRRGRRRD